MVKNKGFIQIPMFGYKKYVKYTQILSLYSRFLINEQKRWDRKIKSLLIKYKRYYLIFLI